MIYTMKNKCFEVSVNSKGAEINSFKNLVTGQDIIWNGSPEVWKFHAPVLFPHCGRIKDAFVIIDEKKYGLKSNGFARDIEFTLVEQSDTFLKFEAVENEYTLNLFPYKFRLSVKYELNEQGLGFTTTVKNTGSESFLFSVGSHSAFKCPRNPGESIQDYQIEFEKQEPLTQILCHETGFLTVSAQNECPCTKPYGESNSGIIPLKKDYFGTGHFITGVKSDWVGLRNKKDGSIVKVNCKGYPGVMLWQNAGEPEFVCLEPWFGMPDADNTDHQWTKKPGLISLAAGEKFVCDQSISLSDF